MKHMRLLQWIGFLSWGMMSFHVNAEHFQADVVVYGDASGGVTAAIQATRMGKTALLVSPCGHLGGLTSSGLGWSDIGNDAILGGISREFYHNIYQHYQKADSWKWEPQEQFANKGQGVPALNAKTQLASTFEPKVAEAVFNSMAQQAGIRIIKGRLDLTKGVSKVGKSIKSIRLENGTEISGKMFIDSSYEGDLLPLAGVSFMIGREANAEFSETGNGNAGVAAKNQLPDGIDPYIVKGNASSGFLPGIRANLGGEKGEADHRLQAYCYRMCLTNHPDNRVPIEKPKDYDEADYEIVFRAIEVGQNNHFFKLSPLPNRKTDSNNEGGISTDFIGMNYGDDWNWATLGHVDREKLAAKHRDWQLGLIWTLQNHLRIPPKIRAIYAPWGLPKDEFIDNGHWPYHLYVREARRMRSDFVMTEAHCKNKTPIEDPVGMGAYALDSHNTQRVVHKGMVKNEGDIQVSLSGKPYGISYRALVPKASECENLLVPWALSSTHISFGSIRMEPVFMVLGQSAATAASMAIDGGIPVQQVPYAKLRERLVADGQKLTP
jgi:hypothetical protein